MDVMTERLTKVFTGPDKDLRLAEADITIIRARLRELGEIQNELMGELSVAEKRWRRLLTRRKK